MKVPVIRSFFDKHTGLPYNRGDVYESEDYVRISELQNSGLAGGLPVTGEAGVPLYLSRATSVKRKPVKKASIGVDDGCQF